MTADSTTPRLALRPREAARSIGVSERTLFTMTKDGRIRCVRAGRAVTYPVTELQRWLDEQMAGGAQ